MAKVIESVVPSVCDHVKFPVAAAAPTWALPKSVALQSLPPVLSNAHCSGSMSPKVAADISVMSKSSVSLVTPIQINESALAGVNPA
ncbi:MAG: hypothetical protein A2868_01875 [Candidatus Levybacteria bacterium RIFCSPHIGHO2_01_FULL_40_15b]|nr:MAG: hypothetical protein A2868_01875 [Candidatus Levybacteria bacterium RIFCSPHIGHO2_01_FULL_40_15b]